MQEQKIAVFPGSFDPLTNGHCDIIARALPLFDKIIIAIGRNSEKNCMFSLEERMDFVRRTYADQPKIEVTNYEGMTVDFCRSIGVKFMLRGLAQAPRTSSSRKPSPRPTGDFARTSRRYSCSPLRGIRSSVRPSCGRSSPTTAM